MKIVFIVCFCFTLFVLGQERFLTFSSKDFIAGVKHDLDWGHFRIVSIFRSMNYKFNDETDSFKGCAFSSSGKLMKNINDFQYQLIGGEGIAGYNTSIASFGYDGYPNTEGAIEAKRSYGGWTSYEHYWTKIAC